MLDRKYRSFSCHQLGEAVAKCKQKEYAAACPRLELMKLLLQLNKDPRALKFDIRMVETKYKNDLILARRAPAPTLEPSTAPDAPALVPGTGEQPPPNLLVDNTQDEAMLLQLQPLAGGAATAVDGVASTAPAPAPAPAPLLPPAPAPADPLAPPLVPATGEPPPQKVDESGDNKTDGSEAGGQEGGGQAEDDLSQNDGSDSEVHTVWEEGKLMCFISAKRGYKQKASKPVYGILAVDVNEESLFGTCIMGDGNFVSYSFDMLYASIERYKDPDIRMDCPTSHLQRLLMICQADPQAFKLQIREAVAEYKKNNRGPFPSSSSEESPMEGGPLSNPPKVKPYHMNP